MHSCESECSSPYAGTDPDCPFASDQREGVLADQLAGTVEMEHNYALGRADLESGYVLTCQSHPTTPTVVVDYDA